MSKSSKKWLVEVRFYYLNCYLLIAIDAGLNGDRYDLGALTQALYSSDWILVRKCGKHLHLNNFLWFDSILY